MDRADADASRLAKRLLKYWDQLFTFLDDPAVILRRTSQTNRSEKGAAVNAALMSIFRTLKARGHAPVPTIAAALRAYMINGDLPPLPAQSVADG